MGQDALKKQLLTFEHGISLQARRKELGIDCDGQWPPHMMFCGNPGTGKTSIARLVGMVLRQLGVLRRGHLVEVQRSDLVAGAIGQTALKTKEKIEEAKGGVLFVDEAYSLVVADSSGLLGGSGGSGGGSGGSGGGVGGGGGGGEQLSAKDFGREAINEIMSCMTDGDPVVIFAGYPRAMEQFVRANPGLFRRIDVRYDFANYTPAELAKILHREVAAAGFRLLTPTSIKEQENNASAAEKAATFRGNDVDGDDDDDEGNKFDEQGDPAVESDPLVVTDARLTALLEEETSVELRAAMNGGLARQLFRKARVHLDAGLTLEASPEEMCTIDMRHLQAAIRDITPLHS